MAEISSNLIKELRERSGAGMMDCKNALTQTEGDIEAAINLLHEKGLGKAAKKADRLASEGLISVEVAGDFKAATISEINSETDFVAKNEKFINLTKNVTSHIQSNDIPHMESLQNSVIEGKNFTEYLNSQIAAIGENLVVRRFITIKANDETSAVNGYVHSNGRVGVILGAKCSSKEIAAKAADLLKNIAMHAAAMKPVYLSYTELSQEFVEKEFIAFKANLEKENEEARRLKKLEKKIPLYGSKAQLTDEVLAKAKANMEAELKAQGKPEKIWDRIIHGQIERFIADNTQLDQQYALLSQFYVMDESKTIGQVLKERGAELGGSIEIVEYVRFELGEGLEKKVDDFAAEVAAQLN
ncbi:MAG: translation elongation factor Ts [Campylobacteraceae bacterium]|jgi:elongation factor Ts|nr:translation elongation factor Ts [Campylobacteraceae bacterium]